MSAPDAIRAAFSDAMSRMYRAEVPLYGTLLDIVARVNARVLDDGGVAAAEVDRLGAERHGAIRLGTPAELATMARVLAVMGMRPVGYYDLSVAGVPVHSTAFRPVAAEALARSPFRIFTSLLRLELIADKGLRAEAAAILARRRIFTDEALTLTGTFEAEGGLGDADAERFVAAVLETFRWHGDASVDAATYRRLHDSHRLIADVVSFKGPHINHLTPRTLDIDAVQAEMRARGLAAKAVIEGPPRRAVPVLLRQTSFAALDEPIRFAGADAGSHTARFGEIEQRGVALTPAGRALYDRLLAQARDRTEGSYEERLGRAFAHFPDDAATLRAHGLAYFRSVPDGAGGVRAEPIVYEDFLPVSAAGIFQSNLGGATRDAYAATGAQGAFEAALGRPVLDPFALYAAEEARSVAAFGRAP